MAFAENLSDFFDEDEFAVAATVSKNGVFVKQITGIFSADFLFQDTDVRIGTGGTQAEFVCRTADLLGVKRGNGWGLDVGEDAYTIQDIRPDGTGVTTLILEPAP